MRNISADLKSAFSRTPVHCAYCIHITSTLDNSRVWAFTSHNENLSILYPYSENNIYYTYISTTSYTPTSIETNANMENTSLSIEGAFDLYGCGFTRFDLMSGILNHARVIIFQVDYTDFNLGVQECVSGYFGDVTITGNSFSVDFISDASLFDQTIGELYECECPAMFGDSRCGIDITSDAYTVVGHVNSVITADKKFTVFLIAGSNTTDDRYSNGIIQWTHVGVHTGSNYLNSGLTGHVDTYTSVDGIHTVTLLFPTPYTIHVDDTFVLTAGCKKRFIEDCHLKYANSANFRGFPYIPTADEANKPTESRQMIIRK